MGNRDEVLLINQPNHIFPPTVKFKNWDNFNSTFCSHFFRSNNERLIKAIRLVRGLFHELKIFQPRLEISDRSLDTCLYNAFKLIVFKSARHVE